MARFIEYQEHPDDHVLAAHDSSMLDFLRNNSLGMVTCKQRPDVVLKGDEALRFSPDTHHAARSSVDCALTGADMLVSGRANKVYSLCRPPGHHASRSQMGGFCFLNNAAIAAKTLASKVKVAILDIDRHHGNGTQDIVFDDGIMYISLNASGVYPLGLDSRQSPYVNNERIVNFNVPAEVTVDDYCRLVDDAIDRMKSQRADILVVSAGFDTSENELPDLDDVPAVKLTRECFHSIGRKIRGSGIPVLVVQEGGYNADSLGKDVAAFLEGME